MLDLDHIAQPDELADTLAGGGLANAQVDPDEEYDLTDEDKWILERLDDIVDICRARFHDFDLSGPASTIHTFVWNDLVDTYLESELGRASNESKTFSESEARGARYTFHKVLKTILKLLAPMTPYITDYIWRELYSEKSIHIQPLPWRTEVPEWELPEVTPIYDVVTPVVPKRVEPPKPVIKQAPPPVVTAAPGGRYWVFKLPVVWGKELTLEDYLKAIRKGKWFGQTKRDVQGDRCPKVGDVVIIRQNVEQAGSEKDGHMHVLGTGLVDRVIEERPGDWDTNDDKDAVRWFSVEDFREIPDGRAISQVDLPMVPRILEPITAETWAGIRTQIIAGPAPERYWVFKLPVVWGKELTLEDYLKAIRNGRWFGQTARDVQGDRTPRVGEGIIIRENVQQAGSEKDGHMHVIGTGVVGRVIEKRPKDWNTNDDKDAVRWFSVNEFKEIEGGRSVSQVDLPMVPRILEPLTFDAFAGIKAQVAAAPPPEKYWVFKLPIVWGKEFTLEDDLKALRKGKWFGQTARDIQGDRVPRKGEGIIIRENVQQAGSEKDGHMHVIGTGIVGRITEERPDNWDTNDDKDAVRWFSVDKFKEIEGGRSVSQVDLPMVPRILEPLTFDAFAGIKAQVAAAPPPEKYWVFKLPIVWGKEFTLEDDLKALRKGKWFGQTARDIQGDRNPCVGEGIIIRENVQQAGSEKDGHMHVIGTGIVGRITDKRPDNWDTNDDKDAVRWFSVKEFKEIEGGRSVSQVDFPMVPRILEPLTFDAFEGIKAQVAAKPPPEKYWVFKLPIVWGKEFTLEDNLKALRKGKWFGQTARDLQGDRNPCVGEGIIIRENVQQAGSEKDGHMHVIGTGIVGRITEERPDNWDTNDDKDAVRWFSVKEFKEIEGGRSVSQVDFPMVPRILEPLTFDAFAGIKAQVAAAPPPPPPLDFERYWLFRLPSVWGKEVHLDQFIDTLEDGGWFGMTARDLQGGRVPKKGDAVVIRTNCDLYGEVPDGHMHIIGTGVIRNTSDKPPDDWDGDYGFTEPVHWFSVSKFDKIPKGRMVTQVDVPRIPRLLEPISEKDYKKLLS